MPLRDTDLPLTDKIAPFIGHHRQPAFESRIKPHGLQNDAFAERHIDIEI